MKPDHLQHIITGMAGRFGSRTRPLKLERRIRSLQDQDNVFGIKVFASDWNTVRQVCQKIDEERDAEHAWRMVSNVMEYCGRSLPAQMKAVHEAVSTNIEESTVLYFHRTKRELASGVLIEIDNRLFVATTSHLIPLNDAVAKLMLVPHTPVDTSTLTVRILDVVCDDNRANDLALLEIEPKGASVLKKTAIQLSRIDPSGPVRPTHSVLLGGYPFALRTHFKMLPIFANPANEPFIETAKFRFMTSMDHFIPPQDLHLLEIPALSAKPKKSEGRLLSLARRSWRGDVNRPFLA